MAEQPRDLAGLGAKALDRARHHLGLDALLRLAREPLAEAGHAHRRDPPGQAADAFEVAALHDQLGAALPAGGHAARADARPQRKLAGGDLDAPGLRRAPGLGQRRVERALELGLHRGGVDALALGSEVQHQPVARHLDAGLGLQVQHVLRWRQRGPGRRLRERGRGRDEAQHEAGEQGAAVGHGRHPGGCRAVRR